MDGVLHNERKAYSTGPKQHVEGNLPDIRIDVDIAIDQDNWILAPKGNKNSPDYNQLHPDGCNPPEEVIYEDITLLYNRHGDCDVLAAADDVLEGRPRSLSHLRNQSNQSLDELDSTVVSGSDFDMEEFLRCLPPDSKNQAKNEYFDSRMLQWLEENRSLAKKIEEIGPHEQNYTATSTTYKVKDAMPQPSGRPRTKSEQMRLIDMLEETNLDDSLDEDQIDGKDDVFSDENKNIIPSNDLTFDSKIFSENNNGDINKENYEAFSQQYESDLYNFPIVQQYENSVVMRLPDGAEVEYVFDSSEDLEEFLWHRIVSNKKADEKNQGKGEIILCVYPLTSGGT